MLIEHRGRSPRIAPTAWIASTAVISGAVVIGDGARILHGAVISAEDGDIVVGANTVIMEHAVIRARAAHPVRIGSWVMIGPHTHINGAQIGDEVFVATGASAFPGSLIGARAELRINSVVHVNTVVESGQILPIGWVAVGNPAQMLPADQHEAIWAVQRTLDFVGTVYGLGDEQGMTQIMDGQSRFYGSHRDDRTIS